MKAYKRELKELRKIGKTEMDRHHRVPRSKGGSDNKENISIVPKLQHRCFHIIFGTMSPEEIAFVLNKTWTDPKKSFVVIDRPS